MKKSLQIWYYKPWAPRFRGEVPPFLCFDAKGRNYEDLKAACRLKEDALRELYISRFMRSQVIKPHQMEGNW